MSGWKAEGGMGHISDSPRSATDRHSGRPLYSPTQIADHINSSTENLFDLPQGKHKLKAFVYIFPSSFKGPHWLSISFLNDNAEQFLLWTESKNYISAH